MIIRCPHCQSTKGYYTLNDFHNVPVYHDADTSTVKVEFSIAEIKAIRKNAYCSNCGQIIGTINEIQKLFRKETKENPIAANRKKKHITQKQLALLLNCSRETIAYWEAKGVRPRNFIYIKKMEEIFQNPNFLDEFIEYYC